MARTGLCGERREYEADDNSCPMNWLLSVEKVPGADLTGQQHGNDDMAQR